MSTTEQRTDSNACLLSASQRHSTDVKLKQDANAEKNDIKLLLLGAGESGKTTIKTQMRYIEGNPPTEEENEQFSTSIFSILTEPCTLTAADLISLFLLALPLVFPVNS